MDETNKQKFVISQKFENVLNGGAQNGQGNEHFDISWRLRIQPESLENPKFSIELDCFVDPTYLKWSIDTVIQWEIISKFGEKKLIEKSDFSIQKYSNPSIRFDGSTLDCSSNDDWITVKCHVEILKVFGFSKKRFRKFDEETMKNVSDVILKVDGEQFFVSKLFLTAQTTIFNSLEFSENSGNSGIPEFPLENIDANDFQVFLEVLYGELSIDDDIVIQLLELAEKFGASTVTRKCEKYLRSEETDMENSKIWELAGKFKLEILNLEK
ncbi:Protein CBG17036 [Caenorhabditis briggsae]|uniref:Protein CBG17036 n=1 Tax=Caenorhabditis briggsae TaxID=6238 RepID=A8XQB6_CAEBR|nr:Protein CBG17036 [Caenorhabditis briggsae]CAP34854.1 Protein CBG17036 [Caenorhabditis briggsae]